MGGRGKPGSRPASGGAGLNAGGACCWGVWRAEMLGWEEEEAHVVRRESVSRLCIWRFRMVGL